MNILKSAIKLKNHSGFRRYFDNTSWLMAERVLRMTVALLVGVYVARYLGPERFGLLSYANSFVGLFLALATLGIDSIVIRELVKSPESRNELLGTAFGLKIFGTIIMWFFVLVSVPITENDNQTNIFIVILSFAILFQIFNVIDFNFQAEVKSKYVVQVQFVQLFFTSCTKLFLIFVKAPLLWFVWVFCFDAFLLALGLVVIYLLKSGIFWQWRWKWEVARKLMRDSWPLILSGVLVSIYVNIDQVMIKQMIDEQAVGIYAIATRISTAWYFIPIAITSSMFPAILNAKYNNSSVYHQRLQTLYDILVWLAILITIAILLLSESIIDLLVGHEYAPAASVLNIAIIASIFTCIGLINNKFFEAENRQIDILYRSLMGVSVNIILNIILINIYGIYGAALATVAAQFSTSIVYTYLKKDSRILLFMFIRSFDVRRLF
ncbi:MAG: flippase [Candidatus Marinimicrobia bacterium]|mgnify:CR=1 FL=1|jgi:O-antigen/teichoic acid export membrane protein|nr:flippase [Candidatus Neomarinimicrobiota bacterium]MBT5996000.1 flippase [Candidatus Neomarinimicrobiota bacterium]MBT6471528.1 flippase [Candidatus Neomarinimicrobiota bacterium]